MENKNAMQARPVKTMTPEDILALTKTAATIKNTNKVFTNYITEDGKRFDDMPQEQMNRQLQDALLTGDDPVINVNGDLYYPEEKEFKPLEKTIGSLFPIMYKNGYVDQILKSGFTPLKSSVDIFMKMEMREYRGMELLPVYKPFDDVYYNTRSLPAVDKSYPLTKQLLDHFPNVKEPEYRAMLLAAFITPMMTGKNILRPITWVAADKKQNNGKSTLVQAIGMLYDINTSSIAAAEIPVELFSAKAAHGKTNAYSSLINPSIATQPVILLDNVKGVVNPSALASIVTNNTITGYRNIKGNITIHNNKSFYITANDAQIGTDIADRTVLLKCGMTDEEKFSKEFQELYLDLPVFIENNRLGIIAEFHDFITDESTKNDIDTSSIKLRFTTYCRELLTRCFKDQETFDVYAEQLNTFKGESNIEINDDYDKIISIMTSIYASIGASTEGGCKTVHVTAKYLKAAGVKGIDKCAAMLNRYNIPAEADRHRVRGRFLSINVLPAGYTESHLVSIKDLTDVDYVDIHRMMNTDLAPYKELARNFVTSYAEDGE